MDVANHLRTIWNHKVIVLLAALAAALAVFVWRTNEPPSFEVETTLEVTSTAGDGQARPSAADAVFVAQGYADRAESNPVLDAAASRSGLGLDRDEILDRTTISVDPESGSITVAARGPSGPDAAALADALAASLVETVDVEQQRSTAALLAPLQEQVAQLELTLSTLPADDPTRPALTARHQALLSAVLEQQLARGDVLTVVSPAEPESEPVSPRPRRDALLAFLVGLVIAAELAAAASFFGDRFSRRNLRRDVTEASGLPVLATVPRHSGAAAREAFRELRTNLALMTPGGDTPSTVAVLGVHAGVGCTHVAIELARAATSGTHPVLLVDADLRRPAVHERFGLPVSPGLTEILAGGTVDVGDPGARGTGTLHVLTAGAPVDDPVMVLSQHFDDRLRSAVGHRFGLTVVDTPPIGALADGGAVAVRCDVAVLVIDASATSRRAVQDVLARLRQIGIVPLGIVVNGARGTGGQRRGRRTGRPASTMAPVVAQVSPGRPAALRPPAAGSDGSGPDRSTMSPPALRR